MARLRGVCDRDAAERLAGLKLFVPRERLPPPETDEFYHADLIGLRAVTAAGKEIGTVLAMYDFGAGPIVELRLAASGASIMLPFTEACVPEIDLAGGNIVIELPQDATQG